MSCNIQAHGALAPLGDSLEDLVYVDSLVLAYSKRRAVDDADARALAQQDLLDEQCKRDGNFTLKLHEAVIRHNAREKMAHVLADGFQIEVLQAALARVVE